MNKTDGITIKVSGQKVLKIRSGTETVIHPAFKWKHMEID